MNIQERAIFCIEKFSDVYPEAHELLKQHWQEIAPYQDLFVLNPNTHFYLDTEKRGALFIVTARLNAKLIGYVVMIVAPHAHYKDVLMATDDIHFLHKDYRKSRIGLGMFRAAEGFMKDRGVKVMMLRTKAKHDHGAIFERMGYDLQDLVYTKRL